MLPGWYPSYATRVVYAAQVPGWCICRSGTRVLFFCFLTKTVTFLLPFCPF